MDIQNKLNEGEEISSPIKENIKQEYKFWDTQPMPKMNEIISREGEIVSSLNDLDNSIQAKLPDGFEWDLLNLRDSTVRTEVAKFLEIFYNNDLQFQQQFTNEFLDWLLINEKYVPEMSVGVRISSNKVLIGFICGKVVKLQLNSKIVDTVETSMLCVHPKLRQKRLTPVLIKELCRQVEKLGYKQGVFKSDKLVPSPMVKVNYYHRAINVASLISPDILVKPVSIN